MRLLSRTTTFPVTTDQHGHTIREWKPQPYRKHQPYHKHHRSQSHKSPTYPCRHRCPTSRVVTKARLFPRQNPRYGWVSRLNTASQRSGGSATSGLEVAMVFAPVKLKWAHWRPVPFLKCDWGVDLEWELQRRLNKTADFFYHDFMPKFFFEGWLASQRDDITFAVCPILGIPACSFVQGKRRGRPIIAHIHSLHYDSRPKILFYDD